MIRDSWAERAQCRGEDTETIFLSKNFTRNSHGQAIAAKLCDGCPVIAECAKWAADTRSTHYVFAGIALRASGNGKRYEQLRIIAAEEQRKAA